MGMVFFIVCNICELVKFSYYLYVEDLFACPLKIFEFEMKGSASRKPISHSCITKGPRFSQSGQASV